MIFLFLKECVFVISFGMDQVYICFLLFNINFVLLAHRQQSLQQSRELTEFKSCKYPKSPWPEVRECLTVSKVIILLYQLRCSHAVNKRKD